VATVEHAAVGRSTASILPGLAGLLVAATFATSVGWPPTRFLSWGQLVGAAAQRVLLVSLVCVITVSILCAIVSRNGSIESDRIVAQMSVASLWLAPLVLFMRENSVWTLGIAAVFTVVVTRSLLPVVLRPDSSQDLSVLSLNSDNPPPSFHFMPPISVAAALGAQTGILMVLAGYTFAGAALVGAGFSAWTWSWGRYAPSRDRQHFSSWTLQSRRLLALALAILFTAFGLFPFLRGGGGFGGGSSKSAAYSAGQRPLPLHVTTPEDSARADSEGNSGIVLFPAKQLVTKLVVPPPASESLSLTNFHNADPLVIPFDGVYWFFKTPDLQPPRTSRQAHASPETVEIRSTDRRPLSIEAHDHLGQLIDVTCCSRIQIAIRNADRYPETVSLELVLVNTSLPNRPSQSLGRMMVRSTRPWGLYEKQSPISETLNFAIPQSRSFRRFDEMKIVFRLDRARADAGAKIAIDHFVLVPRGL
jgi:hypothetical protein